MVNRRSFGRLLSGGLLMLACPARSASGERALVDLAGRRVVVPRSVRRVATVGAGPVLNGFVFAARRADALVNGLPGFARTPRWAYHMLFAPRLADMPIPQAANGGPNLETLLALAPDVVLTSSAEVAESLQSSGLICLAMGLVTPEDVKAAARLVQDVFEEEDHGAVYAAYFDSIVAEAREKLAHVTKEARPRVLNAHFDALTQLHKIGEWWIPMAGGVSVTDNGRAAQAHKFDIEAVLKWNPDRILVSSRSEKVAVAADARLVELNAVRNGEIHVVPCASTTGATTPSSGR